MRTEVGTVETQSVQDSTDYGPRDNYAQDWPASSFGYLEKLHFVASRALLGALQRIVTILRVLGTKLNLNYVQLN